MDCRRTLVQTSKHCAGSTKQARERLGAVHRREDSESEANRDGSDSSDLSWVDLDGDFPLGPHDGEGEFSGIFNCAIPGTTEMFAATSFGSCFLRAFSCSFAV